jgi:hypothetical protein
MASLINLHIFEVTQYLPTGKYKIVDVKLFHFNQISL